MKYIAQEQFLSASKDLQCEIMKWWTPEIGDLIQLENSYGIDFIEECYGNEIKASKEIYHISKNEFTPLLTVGQLIEFIEWKTNGAMEIKITCVDAKNTLLESLWSEVRWLCK